MRRVARALWDFYPSFPTDLGFFKGDLVEVLDELEGGWWEGARNDRRGIFPQNYVEEIPPHEIAILQPQELPWLQYPTFTTPYSIAPPTSNSFSSSSSTSSFQTSTAQFSPLGLPPPAPSRDSASYLEARQAILGLSISFDITAQKKTYYPPIDYYPSDPSLSQPSPYFSSLPPPLPAKSPESGYHYSPAVPSLPPSEPSPYLSSPIPPKSSSLSSYSSGLPSEPSSGPPLPAKPKSLSTSNEFPFLYTPALPEKEKSIPSRLSTSGQHSESAAPSLPSKPLVQSSSMEKATVPSRTSPVPSLPSLSSSGSASSIPSRQLTGATRGSTSPVTSPRLSMGRNSSPALPGLPSRTSNPGPLIGPSTSSNSPRGHNPTIPSRQASASSIFPTQPTAPTTTASRSSTSGSSQPMSIPGGYGAPAPSPLPDPSSPLLTSPRRSSLAGLPSIPSKLKEQDPPNPPQPTPVSTFQIPARQNVPSLQVPAQPRSSSISPSRERKASPRENQPAPSLTSRPKLPPSYSTQVSTQPSSRPPVAAAPAKKTCPKCSKPLSGYVIEALGQEWHEACFGCFSCGKKVNSTFLNISGKPYCEKCGKTAFIQNYKSRKTAPEEPAANLKSSSGPTKQFEGVSALLEWCKKTTAGYNGVALQDWTKSWQDGLALCAIIHHFYPTSLNYNSLNKANKIHNITVGLNAAEKLGVPMLLDPEDFGQERLSMITYISEIYKRMPNS